MKKRMGIWKHVYNPIRHAYATWFVHEDGSESGWKTWAEPCFCEPLKPEEIEP